MAVLLLDRDPLLLDAVDGEGQTALHYAASCAHVDLVALLLERGADKTIQDGDGLTPCNSETEPHIKKLFQCWLQLVLHYPFSVSFRQKELVTKSRSDQFSWNAFCAMIGYFRWNVGYFIMNILVMKYWKWTSNIPDDERQRQHQAGNVGRGLAHSAAWGGALRLMICSLGILKCSKNIFHPQVFDIVGKLGEGSYGSVFKALHKESKQILAIKQVNFFLITMLTTCKYTFSRCPWTLTFRT